jgi:serine/threonine protein kinase
MATNIPKKLGKYDVLEVVGRGGMGIVYKATDPGIGRLVAIKMITVGVANDSELLKRFYREAQSAGKLQHPNIVTIYDLGDQDGNPYMVMEYLEGESLESIIASRRSVPLEQKLNTVVQVCNALSYAHQHNVIHRDIKPANVMVLKDLTVKIVDFGIARIGNENVTRPGQLMGSIPYMSPEQINEKAYVDSRTDIYSAGVVLYQLLTYALPFDGKDTGAILLKILHEPPPPLQTYLSAYPTELDRIIALALAKNPEERYGTADRLAVDLMRVQDELKRDIVSEYFLSIDNFVANAQWNQAKEQILQVLRIDRQNTRANELLGRVEQQIQTQKRSEQARELRVQAEQAIECDELEDALRYLDHAVELDSSSHELRELRNSIAERKARGDQLAALLQRAESARDAGELEEARKLW